MKVCVLNTETQVCENIIVLETPAEFVAYKPGIELAPRHDGAIGWRLNANNEWEIPAENRWPPEQKVRNIRDFRLKKSDKYAYPDFPITQEKRAEWTAYRQALRDITNQAGFPTEVIWPTVPE